MIQGLYAYTSCWRYLISIYLLILISGMMNPGDAIACTGFLLKKSKVHILARSFDWPRGQGMVFVNKRGVLKTAMISFVDGKNSVQWVSRFGSVTLNQIGCDLPNFGVNEVGLAVQGFIFARAKYPPKDSRPCIGQAQWKQYLLDNCATVSDVIYACKHVRIQSPTARFGQHYLACDSSGNCVTMDFVEGKTILHTGRDLPVKAFVDSSTYAECMHYLRNHQGFGGEQAVFDGRSSLDRFVRAAVGIKNRATTVAQAFQILENVKIAGRTQWQVVYDSKTRKIYFRTKANRTMRAIDVSRFSYSCKDPILFANMEANDGPFTEQFHRYCRKTHAEFINEINMFYRFPADIANQISAYPAHFKCREAPFKTP